MRPKLIFGLLALVVMVGSYQDARAATTTVNVGPAIAFSPSSITITQGDTVNWVWFGFHSTTSGICSPGCVADGKWDSGQHFPSFNYSVTFNTPGTFTYYCSVHGSSMQGTIAVQAAQSTPVAPKDVPETDSLVLVLGGGLSLASFLGLKWRLRNSDKVNPRS